MVPLAVVAVIGVGLGTGLVVATARNDAPTDSAQVAGVGQSGVPRVDGQQRHTGDGTRCAWMTDWMDQQLADGRMAGSMMWGDADRMHSTCRSSTQAFAPASDASPDWCADTYDWMRQRIVGRESDDERLDDARRLRGSPPVGECSG